MSCHYSASGGAWPLSMHSVQIHIDDCCSGETCHHYHKSTLKEEHNFEKVTVKGD